MSWRKYSNVVGATDDSMMVMMMVMRYCLLITKITRQLDRLRVVRLFLDDD